MINLMIRTTIGLLMPKGLLKLLDRRCVLEYDGSRDAAINVAVKRLIQYEIQVVI